jgi:oligopeptide transport system substrate-binding protein
MRRMRALLAQAALLAGSSGVAGFSVGCGGGVLSPDLVLVNGGEPANPLIPTAPTTATAGESSTGFSPA